MPLFRLWKSLWQIVPSQSPPKDTYRSVSIPAKCIAVSQIQCKHRVSTLWAHCVPHKVSLYRLWRDNCCLAVIVFIKHALTLTSQFKGNPLLFEVSIVNIVMPTMRKLYGKQQQFFSPSTSPIWANSTNTHMSNKAVFSTLLARLFCVQCCQRINPHNKTVTEKKHNKTKWQEC